MTESTRSTNAHQTPTVIFSGRPTPCHDCETLIRRGDLLKLEDGNRELCLACVGLDGLTFLESGDGTLTRRARKHSTRQAIVCTRRRGNLQRRGILVEPAALERAKAQCEADAEERARARARAARRRKRRERKYVREFAAKIRALYPGCPPGRERAIAQRACEKHSRRVGRTAAAKNLEDHAIHAAVRAHVRHRETNYETLLSRMSRGKARRRARVRVRTVLRTWRA